MARIKEIYMEIQEKLGEEVVITQEIFNQHLIEKGILKESKKSSEEEE